MHVKTHQGYIYWHMFWLFLHGRLAFEFKCPEDLSRNLRVKVACSDKSPDYYSCLLDQQSNTYKESCTDPADFVRPGQKYVIRVFRKNIECDTSRYQPFKFWSQQLSQCVFTKSSCNEAGQIMLNFGSIFGDSACRCDHIKGYAFVNNPKERCYCIPSDEDCTCYKKFCPPSYILTSDYQCRSSQSLSRYSSCHDIKPVLLTILENTYKPLDAIDKNHFRSTEMPPKILYPILIVLLLVSVCLISVYEILIVEKEPIDDFEMFIKKVGLDSFYPEAMEISDVMKIYNKEMPRHLKGIAIMFIRNLVMLNYTCRDKLLEKFIHDIRKYQQIKREDQNDDNSSNSTVNPLDLIVAVFKCSSPMLKQILATKLFMCKLAIPLVFPALDKDRMLVSIWPLRSLVLEWKTNEKLSQHIAVDCPCQIVSFIRLGRPTISKSKLVNEILTDEHHNTFFNKDCNLGTTKRLVSTGMIEVAWCLPSSESILGKICMFLNLRGDGEIYANQVTLLSKISSVVVIIMETKHFNNTHYKQLLKKLHKTNTGVILVMETKNDSNTSINQILQSHSDTQIQLGKPFRYIILPGDGHTRSTVPMNNKIRNVINEITQENEDVRLSERLNACSTDIDEKKECFSMTRRMAEDLMQLIPEKKGSISVKLQAVPLQIQFGTTWTRLNKDMHKASTEKSFEEDTLQKMHQIRLDQLKICVNLNPFMKNFLTLLVKSSMNEFKMFILWLKHFLAERDLQYRLDSSKCNLTDASFGLEHLFREMGQIYEAVSSSETKDAKLEELKEQLSLITARMLLLGHPFEIMDGDTANVPITWVDAVLMNLKDIIGDKKVLTISVLGAQGSGKSTLLSTMFGLQFDVSSRRCTRGVFMHLVPVYDTNFPFEWILVIYTDGLRALEPGHPKYKQNNELATFVIGISDITIVNTKGEYTNEVNYILQILVHALLRLKFKDRSLIIRQRCVFVRNNVPVTDASDRMHRMEKNKFVSILNDITKKAVQREMVTGINSFTDVIEFNSQKSVFNFSNLWIGDQPMWHANPEYSENVAKFRKAFMFELSKKQEPYLTVTGTISRVVNLWDRVLKNDFVFNFQ